MLAGQLPPPGGLGPPAPSLDGSQTPTAETAKASEAAEAWAPLRQRLSRCQWRRTQLLHQLAARRVPGQARHQRRLWAVHVLGPALARPLPPPDWLAPGGPALPLPPGHPRRRPRHPLAERAGPAPGRHPHSCRPPLPAPARLAGLAAELATLEGELTTMGLRS